MKDKYRVEVCFSKNVAYPEFGAEAYSVESHTVVIPYGKKHHFKTRLDVRAFVSRRIDHIVLSKFDRISVSDIVGYSGIVTYLKNSTVKSDSSPIDKGFADSVLAIYLK